MSRQTRKQPKVRVNLDLSPALKDRLKLLREQTEADSMSEVIRRALILYEYLWENRTEEGLGIVRRSDNRELLVLL